jgi:hypothetical protein
MRQLLCVSAGSHPKATCKATAHFDIWAHHPYTSGGPTHHATRTGDVSLGDLPEMTAALRAAVKGHRISSPHPVQFWATEFSWDSSPPDPKGLPLALHARWVAEALFRMWNVGISEVTWFQLRDNPMSSGFGGIWQSGLLFRGPGAISKARPKPAYTAFRFPFVAYASGGRVDVWGRTPTSRRGRVVVRQRVGGAWRALGTLQADGNGIFQRRLSRHGGGPLQASVGGSKSLQFSLKRPPDRFVNPFGTSAASEG